MKNCPFCGSDAIYILPHRKKWKGFFAFCDHCEARGPRHGTREDAEDEWNYRAEQKPKTSELPDGLPPLPEGAVYVGKGYKGKRGVDFETFFISMDNMDDDWRKIAYLDPKGYDDVHYAIVPLKKQVPWDCPEDVPATCWIRRKGGDNMLVTAARKSSILCSTIGYCWHELKDYRWAERPGVPWNEMKPCTKEEKRTENG